MTQAKLFSGQELKKDGMDRAAESRKVDLVTAQIVAHGLGRQKSEITIDDVRNWYKERNSPWSFGNAAGSIFSGKEWEAVGFTPTTHPQGHGRIVRKWRLRK